MGDEMGIEELKQINIDFYINLLRIKKVQKDENKELDYQIKVMINKLNVLGVNTRDYNYSDN